MAKIKNTEVAAVETPEKPVVKASPLNLLHLSKLPEEFYIHNANTQKLEPCKIDSLNLKRFYNSKGNIGFALAVFSPLTLILDDDREKVNIPANKPQLISLPFNTIKTALSNTIKGFFQYRKPIFDKQTGENLGEKTMDFFQIKSTLEYYAFAKCLKVEDILEPIKERSKTTDSNATIKKFATDIVATIKKVVIGTIEISVDSIIHIPFHNELNSEVPTLITNEYLESVYQNIINRS